MKTDFLVIGSGAAGLSFALKAAAHGHVTIVTKGEIEECNTNYAQGGICSVTYAPDTFEKHIRDTLVCGAGKCDEKAVELVVRRAPELIRDLIAWGTRFDKTPDGRFELNREGGHSEHRILHHEDLTGAEIERALVESVKKHPNITVLEHRFAIDLLTQHHLGEFVTRHTRGLACFGAYVLNLETNEIETMLSKFTVVATGGCGNVYSATSNPVVATGDGIAMCHRAKAITENMEFVQFPPDDALQPRREAQFPHHRGHARFRGHPAAARRPGVHGQIPPDEVPRAARCRGPGHLPRDDQAGFGFRLPRRDAQGPRRRPEPLPEHLRKMPLDRHRHHEGLDSRRPPRRTTAAAA